MRTFVALACLVLTAPTFSATHKVPTEDPVATVQIPAKWQVKEYEERIEATSADGTVCFFVMLAERNKVNESMLEAIRYVKGRNSITLKADSEKRERGKVNEMDVRHFSWTGQDKKGEVKISLTVLSVSENNNLLVVYWGSPQATKKHKRALDEMLHSIKKI